MLLVEAQNQTKSFVFNNVAIPSSEVQYLKELSLNNWKRVLFAIFEHHLTSLYLQKVVAFMFKVAQPSIALIMTGIVLFLTKVTLKITLGMTYAAETLLASVIKGATIVSMIFQQN